jgi:hypothetical protein
MPGGCRVLSATPRNRQVPGGSSPGRLDVPVSGELAPWRSQAPRPPLTPADQVPVAASVSQTCRRSRYQGGIAWMEEYLEREDQEADDQAEDYRPGQRSASKLRPATCHEAPESERGAFQEDDCPDVTGNTARQRRRDTIRASAANHTRSADSYRTRPACPRSTALSCRSTSTSTTAAWSPRHSTTIRPSIRQASTLRWPPAEGAGSGVQDVTRDQGDKLP